MSEAQLVQVLTEVRALRTDVQALTQGLTLMVETQDTMAEMLQALMQAATEDEPKASPMEELIRQLLGAIDTNTAAVQRAETATNRLKQGIAAAIVRGAQMDGADGPPSREEREGGGGEA